MISMRVAPKLIVLVRDSEGFGPAISDSLQPAPDSNLTRSEASPFDLSLEKYGITDHSASGELVQFLDPHGSPQVSILLLPNHESPVAACAANEVLASISSENFSNQPTVIIPFIMKSLKANREMMSQTVLEQGVTIYGAEVGATTEFTQSITAGTATPPPSLRIHSEALACFLQIIPVLNLPTVLLMVSGDQHQYRRSADYKLEVLLVLGQYLASNVGLCFSKERLRLRPMEESKGDKEPWRALYG